MAKIHTYDGNNLPPTNTKIKVVAGRNGTKTGHHIGLVKYVASHTHTGVGRGEGCLVVNDYKDADHGQWATQWIYVDENNNEIDGPDVLTDAVKQDLTNKVLAAATKRGYCNETKNILRDIGFPTEAVEKVTVSFYAKANAVIDVEVDGESVNFFKE